MYTYIWSEFAYKSTHDYTSNSDIHVKTEGLRP